MVVVFLSFVLGANVSVKQVGLGLAVAVLIDATVVRMVLVPAVMELLGPANWWLPRPLARILPTTPPVRASPWPTRGLWSPRRMSRRTAEASREEDARRHRIRWRRAWPFGAISGLSANRTIVFPAW